MRKGEITTTLSVTSLRQVIGAYARLKGERNIENHAKEVRTSFASAEELKTYLMDIVAVLLRAEKDKARE